MTTLQDVVDQLKINNEGITKTATNIESFVQSIERNRLDDLENRKKAQRKIKGRGPAAAGTAAAMSGFSMPNLGLLLNPMSLRLLLRPLLAGAAAVTAWFAGMRGWELPLLKRLATTELNLKALFPSSIAAAITQKYVNMRANILGWFGLSADLKDLNSKDTTLKTPITTQIATHFKTMKANMLLKYFGIGVDGLPTVNITGTGKVWLAAEKAVEFLLKPLKALSAGVVALKASPLGLWIMEKFGLLGRKAGGFLKLINRILWPISIVMALFDGVTAFQKTEGTFYEKTKEGIKATMVDFIGSPLELLGDLVAWSLMKAGQKQAADWVTEHTRFTTLVGKLVDKAFAISEDVVDWFVGESGPEGDVAEISRGARAKKFINWRTSALTLAAEYVTNNILQPTLKWALEKVGVEYEPKDVNLMQARQEFAQSIHEKVGAAYNRSSVLFNEGLEKLANAKDYAVATIPLSMDLLMLDIEEAWVETVATVKTGFYKFSDWVGKLPAALLAAVVTPLISAMEKVPGGALLAQEAGLYSLRDWSNESLNKKSGNAAKIAAIEDKRIEDILAINGQRYLLNEKMDGINATLSNNQTTNVVNNTALIEPDINPADRFDPHYPIGGVVLR